MRSAGIIEKPLKAGALVERYIDVDGVRVRYIEAGLDKPGLPVVLLHGFQAGADLWFPHTLPAIAERFHVYALDLPGFGKSGQLSEYGNEAYGRFMVGFFDALGLDKVQLVGHSMGGQVAVATAAHAPGRIERLVLICSAGLPRTGPEWLFPIMMLSDHGTFEVALYPKVFRLMGETKAFKPCLQMLRYESIFPLLGTITMPTLIVWGSRDRVVPLEYATIFARNIPHARLAIMRGCGHRPFYQKPRMFEKIVFGFLK